GKRATKHSRSFAGRRSWIISNFNIGFVDTGKLTSQVPLKRNSRKSGSELRLSHREHWSSSFRTDESWSFINQSRSHLSAVLFSDAVSCAILPLFYLSPAS